MIASLSRQVVHNFWPTSVLQRWAIHWLASIRKVCLYVSYVLNFPRSLRRPHHTFFVHNQKEKTEKTADIVLKHTHKNKGLLSTIFSEMFCNFFNIVAVFYNCSQFSHDFLQLFTTFTTNFSLLRFSGIFQLSQLFKNFAITMFCEFNHLRISRKAPCQQLHSQKLRF